MDFCKTCGRPLSVRSDPVSGDCGGDCWGCIGKIEADGGYGPSREYIAREIAEGFRHPDGTAKRPEEMPKEITWEWYDLDGTFHPPEKAPPNA